VYVLIKKKYEYDSNTNIMYRNLSKNIKIIQIPLDLNILKAAQRFSKKISNLFIKYIHIFKSIYIFK